MFWKFINELKKQFKYMDGILIAVLIVLSFTPYVVFAVSNGSQAFKSNETLAIVTIDGKEVDQFILSEKTAHKEKTYYPDDDKYNIIELEGTKIRVKEDNSPDQIAVKTSWIEKPGQVSICLPHRLMIEVKGISTDEDDMIISY
ncbi:NusG domain II-containing protein [Vagococcus elongatus]|uniref:Uncharacterized protein n=1 Tax=Vagococcus elongatus TaxID=180344 RepID=A0A430B4P8_9ENTE|nr:NusG domain II-containing protein [Vagococcus elongatus]RSU15297.1 hypothetical protein CBF29_02795 [Vagococcus elongatus]